MSDTVLDRFTIGAGKIIPVDHAGPASYAGPTDGETIGTTNNFTGISVVGLGSLDMILGSGSLSESGNYYVLVQATGTGIRKTFTLFWFAVTYSTGVLVLTQVSADTNLSAETVRLGYVGK